MPDTIPLREALQALRAEIVGAVADAATESVKFELGPIEMEFQVVAQREAGGEGKIGFHIFGAEASLGASGKAEMSKTQKVKLSLSPVKVDAGGQKGKIEIRRGGKK
ncbi:hypothetical protein MSC49_38500 (plasmid) [Methylosinus sp. C49]|uniref:trypco2 family protein n=1 Tax=Methylosinus sp. C49 TaxID=2699395 RepID=UPI001366BD15|nr:trypco2 family protein [Methylosinus sp. C49]BBU63915.1 hypothetical protein MSC49_38500 [Methylosinus sp. C49]